MSFTPSIRSCDHPCTLIGGIGLNRIKLVKNLRTPNLTIIYMGQNGGYKLYGNKVYISRVTSWRPLVANLPLCFIKMWCFGIWIILWSLLPMSPGSVILSTWLCTSRICFHALKAPNNPSSTYGGNAWKDMAYRFQDFSWWVLYWRLKYVDWDRN